MKSPDDVIYMLDIPKGDGKVLSANFSTFEKAYSAARDMCRELGRRECTIMKWTYCHPLEVVDISFRKFEGA